MILEDDVQVARSLERALKAQGYQVEVALNASEALEIARSRPLDLILCDVRMPGVDGLEALASLRTLQEGLRSIVMTGYASEDAPIRAIQNRVDDYLLKPVPLDRLLASVRHSAELCRIEKEGRRALDELRGRYLRLISSLVSVFWEKDPWLYEHAGRVAALAVDLGVELGLSAHQLDQLELAAWLHDLGLALIERELLQQNRALTPEERALLDQHPARLRALLEDLPDLRELSPLLVNLRERYDGSGYPRAMKGAEIPIESRVLTVAEVWDSLRHPRPHRPALTFEQASQELRSQAGAAFDPEVVSVCLALAGQQGETPRAAPRPQESRWRTLLRLGAMLAQGGQHEPARQALLEAGEMCRQVHGEDNLEVLVELASLEASRQRPEEALRWLGRVRAGLEGSQAPALYERAARTYLALERAPMARELIERGLALARAQRDLTGLQSLLALRLKLLSPEEWSESLREWLSLAVHRVEPFSPHEVRDLTPVLQAAWDQGLEREALQALRERFPQLGAKAPAKPVQAQATVEVLCFGPPEVLLEGKPVPAGEWASRKALELFLYLVIHRRPVPGERLASLLWPDNPDISRKSLNTAASRARRALRALPGPIVVFERSFFSLDPALSIDSDYARLERLAEQCRPDASGRLSQAARQAGEQAVALYRGELLEGLWSEWVVELRRTVSEKVFSLLHLLAGDQESQGRFVEASQHYQRMLDLDPCREEAQLGQMRCLAGQGLRDTAVRRYNDYCRILQRELGLTPGPEAVRLYHQLLT